MKKNLRSTIGTATRQALKEYVFIILESVVFFLLFFYLFFNILLSQNISSLYTRVVNDEANAAAEFLRKIKPLPEFASLLEINTQIYGETLQNEVYAEEQKNKEKVLVLEEVLVKNPKSRDVLYALYLLYNQAGEKTKAREYLEKAKEIDPFLN